MLLDSWAILQGFKLSLRHEPATHHDSSYLVNAAKQLKTIPRIVWHCTTVFPIPVTNSDRLAGCLTSEQMIPPSTVFTTNLLSKPAPNAVVHAVFINNNLCC